MNKMILSRLNCAIRRRDALALVGATAICAALPSAVLAARTVAQFIEELGQKAILQLGASDISPSERDRRFRELLNEYFDVPRITRFVLGRYVRKATPKQMAEFTKLYEDIAVLTYAHLFASYSGQQFTVLREVGDPEDRYRIVMTEVVPGDGKPPVKLDWQIMVKGSSYAVVDIRVEGASMAITQREEFTAVLDRNGGDIGALLKQLRIKVDQLQADQSKT
jgi:phospholipid transport system substrate-binding protein